MVISNVCVLAEFSGGMGRHRPRLRGKFYDVMSSIWRTNDGEHVRTGKLASPSRGFLQPSMPLPEEFDSAEKILDNTTNKTGPAPRRRRRRPAASESTAAVASTQSTQSVIGANKRRQGKSEKSDKTQEPSGMSGPRGRLRVIPLGGVGEVGKNCTVVEFENDLILLDAGG